MAGKRTNNDHKWPQANKQPRHKAAARIGRAEARQEEYDKLTIQQKLDRLPPAPLCNKQRTKLLAQLEKSKQTPVKETFEASVAAGEKDIADGNVKPHEEVKKVLTKKFMKGSDKEVV